MPAPVVLLLGPTAAGKSALAIALGRTLPCEIVSVDSGLVYRGLDIGTAKPTPEERARVPHHLVDIRAPDEPYSAGAFRDDALAAIAAIHARGRVPLLVGGTLLYFRALERGLAPLPPAAPALRARLEAEAAASGWPALHARLARLDPATAARIEPRDAQRIQRALEVLELTGTPLSVRQRRPHQLLSARYRVLRIIVAPAERGALHAAIETRVAAMFHGGLVAEVAALRARGLSPALPALRAVGYRQVWEHLQGRCGLMAAQAATAAATRALARRQLTWLRGEPGGHWWDPYRSATLGALERLLAGAVQDGRRVAPRGGGD